MKVSEILKNEAQQWELSLSDTALEALDIYAHRLQEANKVMNLTAVDDDEGIAKRHFLDSLRPLALGWIDEGARVVDVGTGAGFPGMPLAIARPDLRVTLADSLNKRVEFLKGVVETLGIGDRVQVIWIRAEDLGRSPEHREQYDFACARAVAAMPTLAEYLLPMVKQGGHMLCWKGPSLPEELTAAQRALDILGGGKRTIDHYSTGDQEMALARIFKSRPTPPAYPRKSGKPSKQPL